MTAEELPRGNRSNENWNMWEKRPFVVLKNDNILYHEQFIPKNSTFQQEIIKNGILSLQAITGWPPGPERLTENTKSLWEVRVNNKTRLPTILVPATSYEFMTKEREQAIRQKFLRIASNCDIELNQDDYENFALYECINIRKHQPEERRKAQAPVFPANYPFVEEAKRLVFPVRRFPTGIVMLFPHAPREEKDGLIETMVFEVKNVLAPDRTAPTFVGHEENPIDLLFRMGNIPTDQLTAQFYYLAGKIMLNATDRRKNHILDDIRCMAMSSKAIEIGAFRHKIPKDILPQQITFEMFKALYESLLIRINKNNPQIVAWFERLNNQLQPILNGQQLNIPTTIEQMRRLAVLTFNWMRTHKQLFYAGSNFCDLSDHPVWIRMEKKFREGTVNSIENFPMAIEQRMKVNGQLITEEHDPGKEELQIQKTKA
ncbi:hypothetical protein GCK72_024192 [Caenorhabditis remanei]|uniref:Uncharacterized protein n=1 Tax=Caenorhabditis remanei TaxID=31234 RepID=A0A6A5FYL5_CAERE|nr:hypothetical protein GCK72_024192 [Caenorhabditis remanei]KAF1747726.1 hypothetical protein GCK72_024192 [Caenorhabditis remanei]